jgi:hypothetical protein
LIVVFGFHRFSNFLTSPPSPPISRIALLANGRGERGGG